MSWNTPDEHEGPEGEMATADTAPPRVVTLASTYGTRDAEIGALVAGRLGVDFLDRDIPAAVAERLDIPEEAAAAQEAPKGPLDRLLAVLARVPVTTQERPHERVVADERRYKAEVNALLVDRAASGCVVLGRAGALILRSVPGALHVRLDGPQQARALQAMRTEGLDEQTAERKRRANDRARFAYGRDLFGVDPTDRDFYHLQIDTTALDIATCVELIITASDARAQHAVHDTV